MILTVADMSASAAVGVKVRYTAGTNGTIQDVAGNAMLFLVFYSMDISL